MEKTQIGIITIKKYITEITLSKSQRPKYWIYNGKTIKCGSRKLLLKFINPALKHELDNKRGNVKPRHLKKGYIVAGFKGKHLFKVPSYNNNYSYSYFKVPKKYENKEVEFRLCSINDKGEIIPIIANKKKVGTPKKQVINGNYIFNHTASPYTVGKMLDAIKLMYYKKFITIPNNRQNQIRKILNSSYPIIIEMEIGDTIKAYNDNTKKGYGRRWDVGNRAAPYLKAFYDFLSTGYIEDELQLLDPFIEDDDRLHVSSGNNSYFTPVDNHEDRYLKFHIYKDTREIWKQINLKI